MAEQTLTIGELAKIVLMKQPTLTKILDRMEEEKLVKRQHSKEDRRSIKIAITKNGKEKVKKVKKISENSEVKINVILMDKQLPLKNGIDATIEIKEFAEDIKIIFLSASIKIKKRALAEGTIDFLKKPLKINDIIDAITKALKDNII